MKSTFFFIAMLLFVNASSDLFTPNLVTDADPALLEIAKDPSSEAVFATMAIQMEARGGFNRVLGLLNELVHDSKAQLHSMTKLWRGVHARCQVSKVKLHGRQEFFETYLHQAQRAVRQSTFRLAEVRDHLAALRSANTVYSGLLKSEIARHGAAARALKRRHAHAQRGLESLNMARVAVHTWTPRGRALVQTHLSEVATAYLEVKEYELPSITEFLERTDDGKVRKRLLEWIGQVGAQLVMGRDGFKNALNRLQRLGGAVESALAKIQVHIRAGVTHLTKAIVHCEHRIKNGNHAVGLFTSLVKQNKALIAANRAYCHNEHANFTRNAIAARSAIKLFREIRHFFVNNYKRIHSYIKAKYHRTA
jgi:hypothetical protein